MPITLDRIERIPVSNGRVLPLFADNKVVNNCLNDSGKYMFKNYKINPLTQLTLDTVDKLTPALKGHQKISNFIMQSCEKLIKLSEKVL